VCARKESGSTQEARPTGGCVVRTGPKELSSDRLQVEEAVELLEETFAARRNGLRAIAAREKDERARKAAADPRDNGNRLNVLR
jgi:hypothetical protein